MNVVLGLEKRDVLGVSCLGLRGRIGWDFEGATRGALAIIGMPITVEICLGFILMISAPLWYGLISVHLGTAAAATVSLCDARLALIWFDRYNIRRSVVISFKNRVRGHARSQEHLCAGYGIRARLRM